MAQAEPSPDLERELPAVPTSVRDLRALTIDFAKRHSDADQRLLSDIALCVSEVASNVVVHAYSQPGGTMRLSIRQTSDQLVIEIADQGRGVSADTQTPGLGVGIPLVLALSDATIDHSTRTGHRVTMRFPCHPA